MPPNRLKRLFRAFRSSARSEVELTKIRSLPNIKPSAGLRGRAGWLDGGIIRAHARPWGKLWRRSLDRVGRLLFAEEVFADGLGDEARVFEFEVGALDFAAVYGEFVGER